MTDPTDCEVLTVIHFLNARNVISVEVRPQLAETYGANVMSDIMMTKTVMAGSDVVQSGCPIVDDFFQHLWPYIGNNTAKVVFQMVKRLWRIRIDQ
ncbi:hypothetical protein TNCV_3411201 [Trichonephila clavipes]|nr:hypothetical protein TNCV_3411201 [Trichonephila clavipes]